MGRAYYPLCFRLDGHDQFLLWYGSDVDGVMTIHGQILRFASLDALYQHAQQYHLVVDQEPPQLYDLDALRAWLATRPGHPGAHVDCNRLLNAWNLFIDVAASTQQRFEPASSKRLCEKLFWGTNPPSLTPPGRTFRPRWRYSELVHLRQVLAAGLALFQRSLGVRVITDGDAGALDVSGLSPRNQRLLACAYAEHVLPYFEQIAPNDDRPRQAIATARLFAVGEASLEDLRHARGAAEAAAWDVSAGQRGQLQQRSRCSMPMRQRLQPRLPPRGVVMTIAPLQYKALVQPLSRSW